MEHRNLKSSGLLGLDQDTVISLDDDDPPIIIHPLPPLPPVPVIIPLPGTPGGPFPYPYPLPEPPPAVSS